MTDSLFILGVLSLLIAISEWLVRRTPLRHLGSALVVIILGAVVANIGVIPTTSNAMAPVPVYDAVFAYIAPIAIFWLLLHVNLREVLRAGLPLVTLFLIGALATVGGVLLAMQLVRGSVTLGPMYAPLGGMFAATYTGGSVNFNALALHYDVVRDGVLYGGAVVVDNIVTAVWIAVTLVVPRGFAVLWLRRGRNDARAKAAPIVDLAAETETLDPRKLALVLALGAGALWLSLAAAERLAAAGFAVPPILIITVLALLLAQVRAVSTLPGARVLAMYGVYLFLAVIGAFCDVRALGGLGRLGLVLLALASVAVLLHGAVTFAAAWLLRIDLDGAAMASQANVGGSTSALALAKSLGREDLLLPAVLLGSLGTAIGTFLGFLTVRMLTAASA